MAQGVMFNLEGPMMQGNWYNPKTGDSFTVRDSFFQDNQFIVTTTDGRMLSYNQLQNYIQSDKPVNIKPEQKSDPIPAEISSMLESEDHFDMLEEDRALINKSLIGLPYTDNLSEKRINVADSFATTNPIDKPTNNVSSNYSIIDRALSKSSLPKIKVSVDWSKEPEKEIQLLTEVMDIPIEEIVEWYISKFNMGEIKENVHNGIEKLLYNKYNTKVGVENGVEEQPKSKPKKIKKSVEK